MALKNIPATDQKSGGSTARSRGAARGKKRADKATRTALRAAGREREREAVREMRKKEKQSISKVFVNNLKIVVKVWRFTPQYLIGSCVEGVVWGILNSVEIIFINRLLNSFDEGRDFGYIALLIALMAGFYLIAYIFDGIYWERYVPSVKQKFGYKIHLELYEKARTVDLASYDDPAYFNDFVWSMNEAQVKAMGIVDNIGKIVNRVVASGAILAVLFTIDLTVTLILLSCSVLMILIRLLGNKLNFRQEKESQPLNRKSSYVGRVYHLADCAKELRTSRIHENLIGVYDQNYGEQLEMRGRYNRRFFLLWGVGWSLLHSASYYGTMLYMFSKLVAGRVMIGGFSASVMAVWRLRWTVSDLIVRFTKFPEYSLFIEKYFTFLSNAPRIVPGDKIPGPFESLEVRDLSFTYGFGETKDAKDGNKLVLENVSLKVKKGGKIALVGYNGAGKTTLIKLIMRLYDPTGGVILYNGVDIREYDLALYRERIGAVFQDYKIFAATVAENILCDKLTEERRPALTEAVEAVSFAEKLAELPNGLDTHLTREFRDKGVNLSGGESQKIAIARVFTGSSELYIMDEPSSALDPLAEYKLNHAILRYAENKTVIFISHRLSTTRMADRIYMFDNGRLAEEGSHNELMTAGGKYAEMFEIQASKYTDNL